MSQSDFLSANMITSIPEFGLYSLHHAALYRGSRKNPRKILYDWIWAGTESWFVI